MRSSHAAPWVVAGLVERSWHFLPRHTGYADNVFQSSAISTTGFYLLYGRLDGYGGKISDPVGGKKEKYVPHALGRQARY